MTNFLIRLFVKQAHTPTNPQVRTAYGKLAGGVGIAVNLLLSGAKFAVGALVGSMAITADAANNAADAASGIVNLVGFRLAEKPPDADHPYGHARFEYLAGLVVAGMVFLVGAELAKTSLSKMFAPTAVAFDWVTAAVLGGSIVAKLWLARFYKTIATRIDSTSLQASAQDSRNDLLTTSAVLVAGVVAQRWGLYLDGPLGLLLALFIVYSGWGLVKQTIDPLLGKAPSPQLVAHIQAKILGYEGVLGTHDLMVHDYGPGRQFASAHVEMAAEADVMQSHEIIDTIERDFLQEDALPVVLHFDPIVTQDEQLTTQRAQIAQLVAQIDPRLSIHDFRAVVGPSHQNLIFDCVVPHGFLLTDSQLKQAIDEAAKKINPHYYCVVTIDHSYLQAPQH